MALQKQVYRMSAEGGIDTKTDEKNVLATNFLELQNIRFTKTQAFTKRFGYLEKTKAILGSDSEIMSGQALTVFKNELLRYSDNNLYSYLESENQWADKGTVKFALSEEFSVVTNGDRLLNPSHDTVYGLTCYAYERSDLSSTDIECRIIDDETGSVVATNTVETGATRPFVTAINGTFFIFYTISGVVKFKKIEFATPTTLSAAVTAVTAVDYTVERIFNQSYIVSPGSVTGLNVTIVNAAGSVIGPFGVPDAASGFNVFSIAAEDDDLRIVYGSRNGSTDAKTVLYRADMAVQLHAPVILQALQPVYNVGSIQDPTLATKSQIYLSATDAPHRILRRDVNSAGTITLSAVTSYQAALMSRPLAFDGKVYFAVSKSTTFLTAGSPFVPFRTYFLMSEDGVILNKWSDDSGAFRESTGGLPRMQLEDDGNSICFVGVEAAEIQSNVSTPNITVPTIVKKYCSNFSQSENYFDAPLGDNLHISGGVLNMYDGDRVVEHGFLLNPEAPEFVSETAVGAVLPDGTYQYITVYKWTDKWGQIHRSAPSLPLSYTVTGGPKRPTIRVFTTAFTAKENVEIEVYRTEADGTVFYQHAYVFADRIINDKSVESLTFDDTLADGFLIENEILYTDGGVLENFSASSSKYVSTYKRRVILTLSDGNTIQYSKLRETGMPVEFAPELKITLDSFGGAATCTATLDDFLIIFKERAIYSISGEGPNNLGEQDDFRDPQLITSDCGCVDINSLVSTPTGIMFKSAKGIYILNRNLTTQYIGAPVEAYNDLTITGATLLEKTNEVRFTTSAEIQLVYDYYHQKWAIDSNIWAIDAVNYQNVYHYIRTNGQLMVETPGSYSDNGSYIRMKIVSSWIQMAGIQGFERFYKMILLGSYKSKHGIKVRFAYDFNPSWMHEAIINAGTILDQGAFGDGDFGEQSPFGGDYPLYQFRVFPKRQKCEAFKFSIEDFKTDGNGEGLSLSNFAAEIGLKPTLYKRGNNVSFAAE